MLWLSDSFLFFPSFSSTSEYFCRYSDSGKSVSFYFFLLQYKKGIKTTDEGLLHPGKVVT